MFFYGRIVQTSKHKLYIGKRKWWPFFFFRHLYFLWKRKICHCLSEKDLQWCFYKFQQLLPETYKTSLIKWLLLCFNLCWNFLKFHHEINIWKCILYKNTYPFDFVNKCIKEVLDITWKIVVSTVTKKDVMIVPPTIFA